MSTATRNSAATHSICRQGIHYNDAWYQAPALADRRGSVVIVRPNPDGTLAVYDQDGAAITLGARPCDPNPDGDPHPAPARHSTVVEPDGILSGGVWYDAPELRGRVGSNVRIDPHPEPGKLTVRNWAGIHICTASLIPSSPHPLIQGEACLAPTHPALPRMTPSAVTHAEFASVLERTDAYIELLRQHLAAAIAQRKLTARQINTLVTQLCGHDADDWPARHGLADLADIQVARDIADPDNPTLPDSDACQCDQIRAAMADGCHNPEGIEESRASLGHYPGCPYRVPRLPAHP